MDVPIAEDIDGVLRGSPDIGQGFKGRNMVEVSDYESCLDWAASAGRKNVEKANRFGVRKRCVRTWLTWLAWLGDDHRLGEGTKLLHYIPCFLEGLVVLID
jgi:hypothetical protein